MRKEKNGFDWKIVRILQERRYIYKRGGGSNRILPSLFIDAGSHKALNETNKRKIIVARAWSKVPLATSYGSGRESRFTGHHGTNPRYTILVSLRRE